MPPLDWMEINPRINPPYTSLNFSRHCNFSSNHNPYNNSYHQEDDRRFIRWRRWVLRDPQTRDPQYPHKDSTDHSGQNSDRSSYESGWNDLTIEQEYENRYEMELLRKGKLFSCLQAYRDDMIITTDEFMNFIAVEFRGSGQNYTFDKTTATHRIQTPVKDSVFKGSENFELTGPATIHPYTGSIVLCHAFTDQSSVWKQAELQPLDLGFQRLLMYGDVLRRYAETHRETVPHLLDKFKGGSRIPVAVRIKPGLGFRYNSDDPVAQSSDFEADFQRKDTCVEIIFAREDVAHQDSDMLSKNIPEMGENLNISAQVQSRSSARIDKMIAESSARFKGEGPSHGGQTWRKTMSETGPLIADEVDGHDEEGNTTAEASSQMGALIDRTVREYKEREKLERDPQEGDSTMGALIDRIVKEYKEREKLVGKND